MAFVRRAPQEAQDRDARGGALNQGAREARPNELNHRARKQVYMHSNIFDEGGPSGASVYAPSTQHQMHDGLKPKTEKFGKAPVPDMHCPRPCDVKATQNAGHGAVGEGGCSTTSLRDVLRAENDNGAIPKEFLATSVNLQWCDPRNEISRNKNTGRGDLSAQVLKRTEFSSELFGQARQVDMSTSRAPKELHAETWNPMESDSAVDHHLRGEQEVQDNINSFDGTSHRDRAARNLGASKINVSGMDSDWAAGPGVSPQQVGGEDYTSLQRRRGEKNYSDLFGHTMGEMADVRQNRVEVTHTSTCSFLDTKSEIAVRNKGKWQQSEADRVGPSPPAGALAQLPVNVSHDRKAADLGSSMFERRGPEKPAQHEETRQVHQNERVCWDTRDIMQTQSEIARRGQLRDFNDDRSHAQRKLDDLGSNNLRKALNAPEIAEAPHNPHRSVARGERPVASGVHRVDRNPRPVSAYHCKQAELQSSIFK